jgi:hypothetical protein
MGITITKLVKKNSLHKKRHNTPKRVIHTQVSF